MKFSVAVLLSLCFVSLSASAGPFTDKLSMCLVKNTSAAEKETFVRWTFIAMSAHPAVKDLTKVSPEIGDAITRDMANLSVKLLAERCKKETEEAIKYEGGKTALTTSFEFFGGSALESLMSHPDVINFTEKLKPALEQSGLRDSFNRK